MTKYIHPSQRQIHTFQDLVNSHKITDEYLIDLFQLVNCLTPEGQHRVSCLYGWPNPHRSLCSVCKIKLEISEIYGAKINYSGRIEGDELRKITAPTHADICTTPLDRVDNELGEMAKKYDALLEKHDALLIEHEDLIASSNPLTIGTV